jgi:type IV pilus assembly protein PilB
VRLGEMLVQRGLIDAVQLQSALAHQRRWGGRLGRAIVHLGFLNEQVLLRHVGEQVGVPVVELGDRQVPRSILSLVPEKVIRSRKVVPLERVLTDKRGPLVVALAEPWNLEVLDELAFATGMAIQPVLASEDDLDRAIARLLDGVTLPEPGFHGREDAIDLPADTNPLSAARLVKGGFGDGGAVN